MAVDRPDEAVEVAIELGNDLLGADRCVGGEPLGEPREPGDVHLHGDEIGLLGEQPVGYFGPRRQPEPQRPRKKAGEKVSGPRHGRPPPNVSLPGGCSHT